MIEQDYRLNNNASQSQISDVVHIEIIRGAVSFRCILAIKISKIEPSQGAY